jgi:hypothetical protein
VSKLIRCGDHSYAQWCCICIHLFDGSSHEWCPVPTGDNASEVENDWVCPECLARFEDLDVDDLRCVCIHCARQLRTAGSNNATTGVGIGRRRSNRICTLRLCRRLSTWGCECSAPHGKEAIPRMNWGGLKSARLEGYGGS